MTDKEKFIQQKKNDEEALKNQMEYYKSLSEVYLCELQDHLEPSKQITIAMGVIIQMNSDLVSYLLKNPSTEKSKAQESRLSILMGIVNQFSILADRNSQIKNIIRGYFREFQKKDKEIADLKAENESLKRSIDLHTQD